MALILLLSMIMFFAMLFATANAIRSEVSNERADFLRDRLVK
jgi:cell division protein FtsX